METITVTYSKPVKNRRGMWSTKIYDAQGNLVLVREQRTKVALIHWVRTNYPSSVVQ